MPRIEYDAGTMILIVDGRRFSTDFLKYFANPDPAKLYKIVRDGDTLTVREVPVQKVKRELEQMADLCAALLDLMNDFKSESELKVKSDFLINGK